MPPENPSRETVTIPVIHERISVSKRPVAKGRTRVVKSVNRVKTLVDEPLVRQSHEITRVPVGRMVDAPAEPRYEGDTLVIPVYEERVVTEKRLFLVEEFRVTRKVEQYREPREFELLQEEVTVERTAGQAEKEPSANG